MQVDKNKGWFSSEFILTVAAMIVGLLISTGRFGGNPIVAQILGIAATVLSSMGYAVNRTMLKTKTATAAATVATAEAVKAAAQAGPPVPPSTSASK